MLGPSLFVAPVMTEGATSRDVSLPTGTTWYDWWTGAVAQSGSFDAPIDSIPVFAPAGAIVPTFTTVPDTLVDGPLDGLVTLSDADGERTIRVFAGAAGEFTEADGTRYSTDGVASGSGTDEQRITTGTLSAGGLALKVEGTIERDYRLEVVAP
jgi:alpha-glucosidase (family GH31 glycosyl hydrolase)